MHVRWTINVCLLSSIRACTAKLFALCKCGRLYLRVFCLRSNLVERNYWRYASLVNYNIYVCLLSSIEPCREKLLALIFMCVCVLSSVEPCRAKLLALCKCGRLYFCVFCLRLNLVEPNYWRFASLVNYKCVRFAFDLTS